MKVLYLIQTFVNPYLEYVPQFGQVRFCGCRASALMACSGDNNTLDDVGPLPPPPPAGMLGVLFVAQAAEGDVSRGLGWAGEDGWMDGLGAAPPRRPFQRFPNYGRCGRNFRVVGVSCVT